MFPLPAAHLYRPLSPFRYFFITFVLHGLFPQAIHTKASVFAK